MKDPPLENQKPMKVNKTFNFIFGTVGTAGTMEMVEVFPSGPDEINTLVIVLVKTIISLLGGIISSKLANKMRRKSDVKKQTD